MKIKKLSLFLSLLPNHTLKKLVPNNLHYHETFEVKKYCNVEDKTNNLKTTLSTSQIYSTRVRFLSLTYRTT